MTAQKITLDVQKLNQLGQVAKFLNEQDIANLSSGSAVDVALPVVLFGEVTSDGKFRAGSVGVDVLSLPDAKPYRALMDHSRRLLVRDAGPIWPHPFGRIVFQEDFESTTNHFTATTFSGAVPANNGRAVSAAHYGAASWGVQANAAPAAGDTAGGRLFTLNHSDAFFSKGAKTFVGIFFQPNLDIHWRSVELFLRSDDSTNQFTSAVRYHRRQAGVAQDQVEYLDATGAFVAANTNADGATGAVQVVGDNPAWHMLAMILETQQAPQGYCFYRTIKFDDATFTYRNNNVSAQPVASNGVRLDTLDFMRESDDATQGATMYFDDFVFADLTDSVIWG